MLGPPASPSPGGTPMRRPLGVLAVAAGLAACAPSMNGAAPGMPVPAGGAAPVHTLAEATPAESDECRVSVARPAISGGVIQATAVRRGCAKPALLRLRILRAVPGDDPVIKSGATREGRVT